MPENAAPPPLLTWRANTTLISLQEKTVVSEEMRLFRVSNSEAQIKRKHCLSHCLIHRRPHEYCQNDPLIRYSRRHDESNDGQDRAGQLETPDTLLSVVV